MWTCVTIYDRNRLTAAAKKRRRAPRSTTSTHTSRRTVASLRSNLSRQDGAVTVRQYKWSVAITDQYKNGRSVRRGPDRLLIPTCELFRIRDQVSWALSREPQKSRVPTRKARGRRGNLGNLLPYQLKSSFSCNTVRLTTKHASNQLSRRPGSQLQTRILQDSCLTCVQAAHIGALLLALDRAVSFAHSMHASERTRSRFTSLHVRTHCLQHTLSVPFFYTDTTIIRDFLILLYFNKF